MVFQHFRVNIFSSPWGVETHGGEQKMFTPRISFYTKFSNVFLVFYRCFRGGGEQKVFTPPGILFTPGGGVNNFCSPPCVFVHKAYKTNVFSRFWGEQFLFTPSFEIVHPHRVIFICFQGIFEGEQTGRGVNKRGGARNPFKSFAAAHTLQIL